MTKQHATLDWATGLPYSTQFEDIYFSTDSGLEETRYVFLKQNQLPERWQQPDLCQFTIAETGFGTGLNFLCAWQLWNALAPDKARLHFISTEKYPLTPQDMTTALALWPELADLSTQLSAQYQHLSTGWHKLMFDQGRVTLTLLIGDANDTLPQLHALVDAWFLDGFAPSKNPEMWQPGLFSAMARLSHPRTTFATFTSAGMVKRGLQASGFHVNKVAGFGRKREMLSGHFVAGESQHAISQAARVLPNNIGNQLPNMIVIGGGIAGASTSRAFAERGWQVTLIERHAELAQEASGNPVGVIYPRLAGSDAALGRIALNGYLHLLRLLTKLKLDSDDFDLCGVLQLAFNSREVTRCEGIIAQNFPDELVHWVDAEQASNIAGIKLSHGGLHFPSAGWVKPRALCIALANHPNITLQSSSAALKLQREGELWQVLDAHGVIAQAPYVVMASANDTMQFAQSAHCELEPVRGQITLLPASAESEALRTVVCTEGYISPASQGVHCIGATFSPNDTSLDVRDSDHEANIAMLNKLAPALKLNSTDKLQGRVSLRCTTSDYLPMAGPLLNSELLTSNPPRHNADPASLPWLEGLYVNVGHGSKGLINAPLCAEIIASALCGEPSPVDAKLLAALDPNRVLLRKMGLKRLALGFCAY